ncbi:SPFH domain-containing protein [Aquincola sp. S2]|uniref:SPFH domain-containing protein n=1 Tax=Pseudaquabacterium terrae TaxID=2732868 RepID=A0ABX2EKN0_9BURK|nr:SPFH domain-containing protein [Aquabacterium terrae]NRF69127.1 SPFH domain-containing protein [Aquabacterium terrae]
MTRQATQEFEARSQNGFLNIGLGLLAAAAGIWLVAARPAPLSIGIAVLLFLATAWCWAGLYMLQPNQAALLMFFGSYRGTDRADGLRWANPFFTTTKLSVRAHNFNSEKLKVNDLRGNPIEIAAAILWRVDDTARATFDVENYEAYVLTQAEAAVRHLASRYAYDNLEVDAQGEGITGEITLRSATDEVSAALRGELQERFAQAGIVVIDAKLTHLAYAPEIAGTMLRRQQAEAVVAARSKIVLGAVGMVELALKGLEARGLVDLDDERKAAMVSNLLVVLCSDHDATPVVNTGTLYN